MSNEEVLYPHQAECAEWLEKVIALKEAFQGKVIEKVVWAAKVGK